MSAGKIFISRASADTDVSEQIARILEVAGYDVTVQQRDFASRNFIAAMDAALVGDARVVALLSPDYLQSDYCRAEWTNAIATDPLNRKQRLVVLRIAPCQPEGLLAGIAYHDLVPYRDDPSRLAAAVIGSVREGRDPGAPAEPRAPSPPSPTPPVPAPPQRRGFPVPAAIALGTLALVLAAGAATKLFSAPPPPPVTGPTQTASTNGVTADSSARLRAVRRYYIDWNHKQLATMWADEVTQAFRDSNDHAEWIRFHKVDDWIRPQSVREGGGDTVLVTVVAKPKGKDPQTYHGQWHLISQDGRWLLDLYTVL